MTIKCTGRRMSGGDKHEHISELSWEQDNTDLKGISTTESLVEWLKVPTNSLYCPDQKGGSDAWVYVNSNGKQEYLQTKADNRWTNNLLALPEF